MGTSKSQKALLLRFNITQTLQIHLTRLKVYTYSSKGAKPFKCHVCKYSSKFKSNVKKHLRSHTGEKPFSCTLCNYKSAQKGNLNSHILTHTGNKHYSCAFCTQSCTTNTQKTRHETICKLNPRQSDPSWVEMKKKFKCPLCPFSTTLNSSLKDHTMTHTGEKPFPCNLCNQTFRSRTNLRNHIFTHTREKPHSCLFCKRGFSLVTTHKNHEKICTLNPQQGDEKWVEEQKKYKCKLCPYSTTLLANLRRHVMAHTGEKPFSCTLCNYESSCKDKLNRHILTHTGSKHYSCAFCKKSFKQKDYKHCHEKTCKLNPQKKDPSWVERQKGFKCQLCPYSTARKSHLKRHMVTHTGDKPFPCTLCNKTFGFRKAMRNHIFTHTREKPYSCQFCKRGFAQVITQKNHEKICKLNPQQGDAQWVEEQKKFKCHVCKYSSIRKNNLEDHLMSHTGEKPYKCPFCFFKFTRNSHLHVHFSACKL